MVKILCGSSLVDLVNLFNSFYKIEYAVDCLYGSHCGPGSSLEYTASIQQELPALLQKHAVRSMFDAGCGDRHWIKHVELPCSYLGGDVSSDFIDLSGGTIIKHEITSDTIPTVDLIMIRDVAIHLSNADRYRLLCNVARSNAKFLLMTQCLVDHNDDVDYSDFPFSEINWNISPWGLPDPIDMIVERLSNKSLCLWTIDQIGQALDNIDSSQFLD
jgi:hypothetical protein